MLIGNHSVLNKSHAFFTNGTATAGAYAANTRSNWVNPSYFGQRRFAIAPKTSFTEGHNLSDAILGPWKAGGLANQIIQGSATFSSTALSVKTASASFAGVASIPTANLAVIVQGASTIAGTSSISTATILAVSSLSSTIAGSGSISTASMGALMPCASSIAGSASISTSNLKGYGAMTATIEVGAAQTLSAGDIWTYDVSAISTAGTAGKKLNDASSGSNPWDELTSSHTTSGTFGALIQKLLTVAKFLGLK